MVTHPSSRLCVSLMGARHMRFWLEASPAHMHAPLAPLAIFGKRAETAVVVIAVANWFVLWRHLVTVGRQLCGLPPSLPMFRLGLWPWKLFLLVWTWSLATGFRRRYQTKLNFGGVHDLFELLLRGSNGIRLLSQGPGCGFGQFTK